MNRFEWKNTKQLSLVQILLAFAVPSAVATTGFRIVLPRLVEGGVNPIVGWSSMASIMLFLFGVGAVVLLKKDANEMAVSLKERMCFKKLSGKQWLLSIGMLLGGMVLSGTVIAICKVLAVQPFIGVPEYYPFLLNPTIDPMTADMSVLSPGLDLRGAYFLIPLMILTLVLNIFVEDIYFRGYLLPKMNRLGHKGWILNSVLFMVYHIYQIWLWPQILIAALIFGYVTYRTKSVWPSLVLHMVINCLNVIALVALIMG